MKIGWTRPAHGNAAIPCRSSRAHAWTNCNRYRMRWPRWSSTKLMGMYTFIWCNVTTLDRGNGRIIKWFGRFTAVYTAHTISYWSLHIVRHRSSVRAITKRREQPYNGCPWSERFGNNEQRAVHEWAVRVASSSNDVSISSVPAHVQVEKNE